MKLTEKQKRFCDYYIENGGNGADAARKAGYRGKNHDNIGTENLRKVAIREYIEERNNKLASGRIADMQEVKELWTNILRGKTEGVELKDILKATEYIAKTNGAFLDKVQHSGDLNVNIEIDYGDDDV